MTHDKMRGNGFFKSSIEHWEETTFEIDYHIKGNTEINFGMAIYTIYSVSSPQCLYFQ